VIRLRTAADASVSGGESDDRAEHDVAEVLADPGHSGDALVG
jgi:hypothetical protein